MSEDGGGGQTEVNDDLVDDEAMELGDDSPGGVTKPTLHKTKRRRRRREKPPQPVTDVLITSLNDVMDHVSLTSLFSFQAPDP